MLRLIAALAFVAAPLWAQTAPLPSWTDGPHKTAILDFIEGVTDPKAATFVPVADRIAVFDNDGTLWAEQPVYFQFFFALDQARKKAAADPAWASTPALKAAAAGDMRAIMEGGEPALIEIVTATHSGMSVEDFTASVADWIATAKHPQTGLRYTQMTYRPMVDLLDYLRENEFQTYIVSGGGVDFMRAFAETSYGIPPQNVIGSLGKVEPADRRRQATGDERPRHRLHRRQGGKAHRHRAKHRQAADLRRRQFRRRPCNAAMGGGRRWSALRDDCPSHRCDT